MHADGNMNIVIDNHSSPRSFEIAFSHMQVFSAKRNNTPESTNKGELKRQK